MTPQQQQPTTDWPISMDQGRLHLLRRHQAQLIAIINYFPLVNAGKQQQVNNKPMPSIAATDTGSLSAATVRCPAATTIPSGCSSNNNNNSWPLLLAAIGYLIKFWAVHLTAPQQQVVNNNKSTSQPAAAAGAHYYFIRQAAASRRQRQHRCCCCYQTPITIVGSTRWQSPPRQLYPLTPRFFFFFFLTHQHHHHQGCQAAQQYAISQHQAKQAAQPATGSLLTPAATSGPFAIYLRSFCYLFCYYCCYCRRPGC